MDVARSIRHLMPQPLAELQGSPSDLCSSGSPLCHGRIRAVDGYAGGLHVEPDPPPSRSGSVPTQGVS